MTPKRPLDRMACLGAVLTLALAAPMALAQSPSGLHTDFRLLNGMSGGASSDGSYNVSEGWIVNGPLVSHGSQTVTNPSGMISTSDFTAYADYGNLRFHGSGNGTSIGSNGALLAVDVYLSGEPRAQFQDRLYVTSSSLPSGTPVTIQLEMILGGYVNLVDRYPLVDYYAEFSARRGFTTLLDLLESNTVGTADGSFITSVGDSVDLRGSLNLTFSAEGLRMASESSASVDADLQAHTLVTSLTPGVTFAYHAPTVDVPRSRPSTALSLEGARPNPATDGRLRVWFTLPAGDPATLTLFDVSGRIVSSTDVGGLGPGLHSVDLSRGRIIATGVYLARLVQRDATCTTRIVAMH